MSYYFAKALPGVSFDDAIARVTAALQQEGFGILTEIDVRATIKKKLDRDFRDYRILGACNPSMAWQALQAEGRIGTMLPCNVIVQRRESGDVEVAAVDPVASMGAIDNPQLAATAKDVQLLLREMIGAL